MNTWSRVQSAVVQNDSRWPPFPPKEGAPAIHETVHKSETEYRKFANRARRPVWKPFVGSFRVRPEPVGAMADEETAALGKVTMLENVILFPTILCPSLLCGRLPFFVPP